MCSELRVLLTGCPHVFRVKGDIDRVPSCVQS